MTNPEINRIEQKERLVPQTLYHGSKYKFSELKSHQAEFRGEEEVPEGELLDAIYLTPDYYSALAIAASPEGVARIEEKDGERTIQFEHPELFDPEQEIYIYSVNSDNIPQEYLRKIDDNQYAIVGLDSISTDSCEVKRAGEVFKYYKQKKYSISP